MKQARMIGLLFLLLLLSVGGASAAQNRLNITMTETVYQNVTYGEDFWSTNVMDEDIVSCRIEGVVNVTNPSGDTIADVNLSFINTDNMSKNFTWMAGRSGSQIAGVNPGDTFIIHIPELRGGNYSTFNYTINCTDVEPPLNIETNYSNPETSVTTKVLAGHNWTVNQSATNQLAIGVPVNNVNITIEAQMVLWNATSDNFSLMYLYPEGDAGNVVGNGTDDQTWWWVPNGGALGVGGSAFIVFVVRAPDSVPTSNTYNALREILEYEVVGNLASNLTLNKVLAVGDIDIELDKQILWPATAENVSNVTWGVNGTVTVPLNLSYNLTKVAFWVTSDLSPANTSSWGGQDLMHNETPNKEINESIQWTMGSYWEFNYTDASNNISARPPIVWIRPYFTLMNAYGQIINTSVTRNGEDYYLKYIYVINGYWLQIDKNITSVGDDVYRIDTLVQNIGNAATPEGLVVTVYDYVPADFAAWNWTIDGAPSLYDGIKQNITGGGFNGTAYRWTVPLRGVQNASLYPVPQTNSTYNISYAVNGSGDYKVSELYIVGLDPRKVEGAGSLEYITVRGGLGSSSAEVFYVGVVLFLIIINVVNFVMTRRINQKLNKR
ncbi:hypothetical protein GF367_03065 [Candidatus Woesearchaeota archaeon]|nr:hypothetical protein [Candidatus Woesearchaeota archaeon]